MSRDYQTSVEAITSVEQFDKIVLNTDHTHSRRFIFCDFYAQWCGPCKRFAPELETICKEFSNIVYFVKVDIDVVQALTDRYDIMKLPTFMIYDVGNLNSTYEPIVGADKKEIDKRLRSLIEVKELQYDF